MFPYCNSNNFRLNVVLKVFQSVSFGGGGPFTKGVGQKIEKRVFRGTEGPQKFWNTFFENFGKSVNEDSKKVINGVVLIDISRKFRKNAHFSKFLRYIYHDPQKVHLPRCLDPLPKNSTYFSRYFLLLHSELLSECFSVSFCATAFPYNISNRYEHFLGLTIRNRSYNAYCDGKISIVKLNSFKGFIYTLIQLLTYKSFYAQKLKCQ